MQKLRLENGMLARALHQQLHSRLLGFCKEYSPELPGEPIIQSWLQRLYDGDGNLHILVTLDDNLNIIGHAVIDVQEVYGSKVVWCHQAQGDKGAQSTLDEGVEYVDKLVNIVGAYCSIFITSKHIKALEKKYNYKPARSIMVKYAHDVPMDNSE